jgi:hypothetical protein
MFLPPDANPEAGILVDAAQSFLKSPEGTNEELAFVLVVDRKGQWRSVRDRGGQVVRDEHPLTVPHGQFEVAGWFVGHTSPSICVRVKVNGYEEHTRYG